MPAQERQGTGGPFETAAFVITNLIKLGGLVFVFTQELTPESLAFAAFMLAGAQGLEGIAKGVLGK